MNNFSKILLFPFALLYGLATYTRNKFFDFGILSSKRFSLPIISVGNLSTGGTGKTPHTEYLIALLSKRFKVATLSRGYGRRTKGFIELNKNDEAIKVGDEPLQLKRKFENIRVFVGEKRVAATEKIIKTFEEVQALILDDAFQHRYIEPSINILLTTYQNLYTQDQILPVGRLREWRSGAERADLIVVTKTPYIFSPLERRIITQEINPLPHQQVLFSYFKYGDLRPVFSDVSKQVFGNEYFFSRKFSCILVTGIANSDQIKNYLGDYLESVKHVEFNDHYQFKKSDIEEIKAVFESMNKQNKIIITSEKDATRLSSGNLGEILKGLPVFYLPIEVEFHGNDKSLFDDNILDYVGRN